MSETLIENVAQAEEQAQATDTEPSNELDIPERVVVFEEGLEAILFAAGHPVSYATLARVFEMTPSKVKDKIFAYSIKYNDPKGFPRGVMLLTYADSCQLCTKENYLPEIRDALGIRKSGSLSTAAMETLAVVAYNQPVTRLFVDTVRKVDSSYAMNSLIDRGLIECVGRLDVPGRPMQYGTTSDFLRCFGLNNIKELPTATEDLIDMFEKVKLKEEEERATEPEQLTIEDMEGADKPESEAEIVEKTDDITEVTEETSETPDDEPSAEDDIVDID
jgi:segregation and condensation protein B